MGGIDGFDWSVFGSNPAPGDPDGVRAMAARLRDLADEVDQQNRLLRSVSSDSHSVWSGPAAEAFRPHLDKLPGQLQKLTRSYHDAADALDRYARSLDNAQQLAVRALHKAHAAELQVQADQAEVTRAETISAFYGGTYNQSAKTAMAIAPDPTGATALHLLSLQTGYQNASNQLATANAALGAANANLQAAYQMAESARTQAKAAAAQVAAALRSATNPDTQNPHRCGFLSVFDEIEGFADGKAMHRIEDYPANPKAISKPGTPIGQLWHVAKKYGGKALHEVTGVVSHQFEVPRNPSDTPVAKAAHETTKLAARALPATARYLGTVKYSFEGCGAGGFWGLGTGAYYGLQVGFPEVGAPVGAILGCFGGAVSYNYAPGYEIPAP